MGFAAGPLRLSDGCECACVCVRCAFVVGVHAWGGWRTHSQSLHALNFFRVTRGRHTHNQSREG